MMYKSWQVPGGFLTLDGDEEYLLPPAGRRQYIDDPMVCLFNHDGEVGSWE